MVVVELRRRAAPNRPRLALATSACSVARPRVGACRQAGRSSSTGPRGELSRVADGVGISASVLAKLPAAAVTPARRSARGLIGRQLAAVSPNTQPASESTLGPLPARRRAYQKPAARWAGRRIERPGQRPPAQVARQPTRAAAARRLAAPRRLGAQGGKDPAGGRRLPPATAGISVRHSVRRWSASAAAASSGAGPWLRRPRQLGCAQGQERVPSAGRRGAARRPHRPSNRRRRPRPPPPPSPPHPQMPRPPRQGAGIAAFRRMGTGRAFPVSSSKTTRSWGGRATPGVVHGRRRCGPLPRRRPTCRPDLNRRSFDFAAPSATPVIIMTTAPASPTASGSADGGDCDEALPMRLDGCWSTLEVGRPNLATREALLGSASDGTLIQVRPLKDSRRSIKGTMSSAEPKRSDAR